MPRQRQRVRLESGLSLNINRLIRRGTIRPPTPTGPVRISWTESPSDEVVAVAYLSATYPSGASGTLKVQIGDRIQWLTLVSRPCRFGGRQWYFRCERSGRRVSKVWRPPGALNFGARQTWGRQVAYGSQFEAPHDRARAAAASIRVKVGGPDWAWIDDLWPPKPRWMRWRTYQRLMARLDRYESVVDERTLYFAMRLLDRS